MNPLLMCLRSRAASTRLAQLVMGISALVALASSPPPRYATMEERELQLVFDEQSERRLLLRVELAGKLFAEAGAADVQILARADRTASDLELSVRAPDAPEASPEVAPVEASSEEEADFRAGLEQPSEDDDPNTARPELWNPTEATLSVRLQCAVKTPGTPPPESCVEQLEITLARDPERPLTVELDVSVYVGTKGPERPSGTFEVTLEEIAP